MSACRVASVAAYSPTGCATPRAKCTLIVFPELTSGNKINPCPFPLGGVGRGTGVFPLLSIIKRSISPIRKPSVHSLRIAFPAAPAHRGSASSNVSEAITHEEIEMENPTKEGAKQPLDRRDFMGLAAAMAAIGVSTALPVSTAEIGRAHV